MPSVYVAGAVAEVERSARMVERLRDAGCTITHDWASQVLAAPDVREECLGTNARRQIVNDSLGGVAQADVIVFLVPATASGRGSWFEVGYAQGIIQFRERSGSRGCGPPIVIACGDTSCSVFVECATERFESDEAAVAWIRGRYAQ